MADCKIFIKNIPFKCSEKDFSDHVRACNGVTEIDLRKDQDGKPRGIAVVTFSTAVAARNAITKLNDSDLGGRKLAVSLDKQPSRSTVKPPPATTTEEDMEAIRRTGALYVRNLSLNVDQSQFRAYFEQQGELLDCHVLTERETGKSRGAGFVTFVNPEVAVRVLNYPGGHRLEGREMRFAPRLSNDKPQGRTITVHGGRGMTESDFRGAFAPCGTIQSLRVVNKPNATMAVIEFHADQHAAVAARTMNGKELATFPGALEVRVSNRPPRESDRNNANKNNAKGNKNSNNNRNGTSGSGDQASSEQRNGSDSQQPNQQAFSKNEVAVLRYFELYLKSNKADDLWVKKKKGQSNSEVLREMQIQSEVRSSSLSTLTQQLELGATYVGDVRARLLSLWNTLIKHSSNKNAPRFKDGQGGSMTFKQAFVASRTLENIVITALRSPLSTPVSPLAFPDNKPVSVVDTAVKLFQQVLAGDGSVHRQLIDALEHLAQIGQSNLAASVQRDVANLISSFKHSNQDTSSHDERLNQINKRISQAESTGQPASQRLALYEDKWRAVLKMTGGAGSGVSAQLHTALSQSLDQATSKAESQRLQIEKCDQETADLTSTSSATSGQSELELARIRSEQSNLETRRAQLKLEMKSAISTMGHLRKEQEDLKTAKSAVMSRFQPKIAETEEALKKATSVLAVHENRKHVLDEVAALLDGAHSFLCSRVKERNTLTSSELPHLREKTQQVAKVYMEGLLVDMQKKQKKVDFCNAKLASMRLQEQEMRALGITHVASDLSRGIEKLTKGLDEAKGELSNCLTEADRVNTWIATLHEIGMLSDQDVLQIAALHTAIAKSRI